MGVGVEVAAVLEPFPVLLFDAESSFYPPDFESVQRDAIKRAVERRLRAVGARAEQWPVEIFFGEPAKTIVKVASDRDSTMIVVGLGKHDVLGRLPGGERALHVLRAADRPVLAVALDAVTLPRTAVVGMDFSPASVRAARAALLMLADDGLLVLVHVRPLVEQRLLRASAELSSRSYEKLLEQWRGKAEREAATLFSRLLNELKPYVRHNITLETQITSGPVLERLLAAADKTGAHMIAVGTHGAGILERFFVGSVATEVLRHSGRTVLVAPAPNPAECGRISLRLQGAADFVKADDWAEVLEKFSARNAGRRVRLEVDDPDLGAQVQQSGFAFLGATYDHHDQRVELMMGEPQNRTRHLTRSIPNVDDVAILASPNGAELVLRVLSGRAQTLLTFTD